MIKSNPIGALLAGIFLVLAVGASALVFTYVKSLKTYLQVQAEAAMATRNQALVQNLVMESVEYAKRNPSIEPLLNSMGIRLKGNPSQPAAAGSK